MITYTKQIISLQAYKEIDGETNVVFSINWALVGKENGYTATYPTSTLVPYVAGQSFVPYADLTQAIVEGWIDEYTTPEQMQAYTDSVDASLAQQQQQETPPLPWVPEPTPSTP